MTPDSIVCKAYISLKGTCVDLNLALRSFRITIPPVAFGEQNCASAILGFLTMGLMLTTIDDNYMEGTEN